MRKDYKSKQLGMPYGTASQRLKKMIMFKLVKELKRDFCYRCGERIEHFKEISVDHKKSWLHKSNELFWDLDNISFSHLSCNSANSASSRNIHPSYASYSVGCRCKACTMCKMIYSRYWRWLKKRNGR